MQQFRILATLPSPRPAILDPTWSWVRPRCDFCPPTGRCIVCDEVHPPVSAVPPEQRPPDRPATA